MVDLEGIEPNCRHPTYYGKRFTVSRREQSPYLLNTLSRYAVNRCAGGGGECVLKYTSWRLRPGSSMPYSVF